MDRAERVILRAAAASDAPEIAAIWRLGWEDGHRGHVPDALAAARTPESFAERAAALVGDTVVAVVGDRVAGFVMVVGDELEQIYVAREHRGTGVAAALLAEAERLVAAGGHARAWLAVAVGNERAQAFYRRNGWSGDGRFSYLARVGESRIPVPCRRFAKTVA